MSELSLWGDLPQQETAKPVKQPKPNLMSKANQPYIVGQNVWYQDGDELEQVEVLGYTRVNVKIQRAWGIPTFVKLDELSAEKPE